MCTRVVLWCNTYKNEECRIKMGEGEIRYQHWQTFIGKLGSNPGPLLAS